MRAAGCICAVGGFDLLLAVPVLVLCMLLTCNSPPHVPAGQWASLTPFQRILVLRALKPDRLPAALAALCEATLGAK